MIFIQDSPLFFPSWQPPFPISWNQCCKSHHYYTRSTGEKRSRVVMTLAVIMGGGHHAPRQYISSVLHYYEQTYCGSVLIGERTILCLLIHLRNSIHRCSKV